MPFPKKWKTSLPLIRMEYDINIPYSYGVSPIVLAIQVHEGDEQVERDEGGREKERIRNACVYKERERERRKDRLERVVEPPSNN